ncbi:MAG TPA: PrsW family intramembrane metalloprotease [Pseudolysinimonas sp.]|nr:PrsW family intramembrane metalloprotease [Pseudolysinimonas sp.]
MTSPSAQPAAVSTDAPEAPEQVQATTQQPLHPALVQRHRTNGVLIGGIIGFIVAGVALLLVIAYLVLVLGPGIALVGGILALVPLTVVLLGVHWIDRWEPEPRGILLFAFLWGAGVSIVIALFVDSGVQVLLKANGGPTQASELFQAIVQAPIVEEGAKGLGVLLIFLVANKYFDGPVDGIVYAATVAAGFAFAENIQYFGLQIVQEGGFDGSVGQIFFLRGILSPFAHAMFTSMTGLFIGIAAQRGGRWLGVLFFFIGWIPAALLHAFWNGSLSFVYDFFGYYFAVQVPLFILAIVMVVLLRRRDTRMTQLRLGEYAAAGWFNPNEVVALATPAGRRASRAWARSHRLGRVMRQYIQDATRLAFTRNRIVTGRDRDRAQYDEAALLAKVTAERATITAGLPPANVA